MTFTWWNWPWWRVVHHMTIHNKRVRSYDTGWRRREVVRKGSGEEGKWWWREVVMKGSGDDGKWWRRDVVTKGSGDKGKWWGREVVTMGSGEKGKWWEREVVTKGSGDEGKWWRREVVTKGSGDEGKWRWREVVTMGSGDEGKWWRREVVTKGSGEEGKWWRRKVVTKGSGEEGKWWRWEVVTKGSGDEGRDVWEMPSRWNQIDDIAEAKCQTSENTQSKMPGTQIPVWGYTQSKMPRKSGARYSRCGADAAFQQWGTVGIAPRQVICKLLCRRQQRFRRNWPANAILDQKIWALRFQDLCNRPAPLRKLLGDFQTVVAQTKIPTDCRTNIPWGPALSVVIKTSCAGRPLCPVLWIKFSRLREDDTMWQQITRWTGRSDRWHKWLNSVNVALCRWGICPSASIHSARHFVVPSVSSTWCESSTTANPGNFAMSSSTFTRERWSCDQR